MSTEGYDRIARMYDLQHRTFTEDVPMYIELARRSAAKRGVRALFADVLEFGCGTARVMRPLLEVGHRVVGVDLSTEMLALGRANIEASPLASAANYELRVADVRTMRLGEQFDLIIFAINSFLHNLTSDDQLATLQTAREHLRSGGMFVTDLPANDELANQPWDGVFDHDATFVDPQTGSQISKAIASRVFWASQEQELTYRFEETDRAGQTHVWSETFRLRHVFRFEMELLLRRAGFGHWQWHGDYSLSQYADGSPRMIAVVTQ